METQPTQRTLIESFCHWEDTKPDDIYLRQPVGDAFIDYSWHEVGRQARSIVAWLQSLDLPPQSNIGLISKNCAHWLITDIAIGMAGHVSVPFYPTLTGPQLRQVMDHSGCKVLFVGKLDNWPEAKQGVPVDVRCVALPTYGPDAPPVDRSIEQWDNLLDRHDPISDNPVPDLDDLFSIIYTSGTTGNPKGVMLDYRTMVNALENTHHIMRRDIANARFFSYLPLCHIAERNIVEATGLATGGTIYFSESLETFAQNLRVARPTHFLAVPRIWTKFQQGLLAKLPPGVPPAMLPDGVKKLVRQGLGLDEAVVIITGAAPMPVPLIQWFRGLDIHIQEAYGMSENLGAVSLMPPDAIKDGTVGKVYAGMDVKIDPETGELATRCSWLMRGYYKEPALTAKTMIGGWLYTGDVAEVDADGYLTITGRVKDMYKSPKGEYIAPAQIEFGFAGNNHIEQVCVAGQNLPQPIALVVLSDVARNLDRNALTHSLEETLDELNPRLHSYERVKKIVVMAEPWTVENNRMTPTMKIKRNVLETDFAPDFERWYAEEASVVWL